jgi:predicted AlkP superfamily phosphohydrolase/phosphomutase
MWGDGSNAKIIEFYRLLDRIIESFFDHQGDEYSIIVFGDHGHATAPESLFSLNEFLRRNGIRVPLDERTSEGIRSFLQYFLIQSCYSSHTDWIALMLYEFALARGIASAKAHETVRHCSSYAIASRRFFDEKPCGGICVNAQDSAEKRALLSEIVKLLSRVPIIESVEAVNNENPREGNRSYPDILFRMKSGYGIYHGLHVPLLMRNYRRRAIPGRHGELTSLIMGPGFSVPSTGRGYGRIEDIYNWILEYFGITNDRQEQDPSTHGTGDLHNPAGGPI